MQVTSFDHTLETDGIHYLIPKFLQRTGFAASYLAFSYRLLNVGHSVRIL